MARPSKHARRDRAEAFVPEPGEGEPITSDDAEAFAEEFIASVTGAEFVLEDARNEETDEEIESIRTGALLTDGDGADDEVTAADA